MQADRSLGNPEIRQRIRSWRLLQGRQRGHDQALMATPAYTNAKQRESIDEGRNVDRTIGLEGKEPGRAQQRRPARMIRESRMHDAKNRRMVAQLRRDAQPA